jgi:molecular chaperone GrpE (heat shock protein)
VCDELIYFMFYQIGRDALLEEVSFLSSRLTEYEDEHNNSAKSKADIKLLVEQNNTLLLLLGEKEEELESIYQDMKDIKSLYQAEIENLVRRVAPEEGSFIDKSQKSL